MKSKTIASLTANNRPCIKAIITKEESDDGRDHILRNFADNYPDYGYKLALVKTSMSDPATSRVFEIYHECTLEIIKAMDELDLRAINEISGVILKENFGYNEIRKTPTGFEFALEILKKGKKMRRKSWSNSMFVEFIGYPLDTSIRKCNNRSERGYEFTTDDLVANDWECFDDMKEPA